MKMAKLAVVLLMVCLLAGVGFSLMRAGEAGLPTPDEVAARIANGDALLIDVREPHEWKHGILQGALLLTLTDLRGGREEWAPVLASAGEKVLILYCRTGNRSGQAAALLAAEGFETINLGGFEALKRVGFAAGKP